MKKRILIVIVICFLLLVLTGCKLSKSTLVSWSQSASSVTIKYRISNLGNKDILSYTVYFVIKSDAGQQTANPTFNEVINEGSIITRTYVYSKPFVMNVTDVSISHHSATWSP